MSKSNVAISYNEKITYDKDVVYEMLTEAFRLLGLDQEHWGSDMWNPLVRYITPGNHVLIKPNLVMHYNASGDGEECLYTQAPVVDAVIKYVVRALNGEGKIIVGDAPMQRCEFDLLVQKSGYSDLIEKWKKAGVDICLCDFRNTTAEVRNGIVIEKENYHNETVLVDLANESCFTGLSETHLKNMRVTSYDPRVCQEHHQIGKHEYLIAKEILDADVIINLPKPKTHRKAGVTAALKNLVGINCSKEYLPHHTKQSVGNKGDSFAHKNIWLQGVDECADKKCIAEAEHKYTKAQFYRYLGGFLRRSGKFILHEKYSEGSWYGNDTIWRTICDLNMILQYADKNGHVCQTRQRKFFNIGDMIIAGEKDGPLRPTRKEMGVIIAGEDPCSFDEVVTALMGFDGEKIPTIKHMRKCVLPIYFDKDYFIFSNDDRWNRKDSKYIYDNCNLGFQANPGWAEVLK